MKIIDNKNRDVLSEGRNSQMGFAFCKQLKSLVFETVQPISPCKDYLNDVIWSENTNKTISACGLKYKKEDILNNEKVFLAFKICPRQRTSGYERSENGVKYTMEDDVKNLRKNYKNIQLLLNYLEEKLKIKNKSIIALSDDKKTYLAKLNPFWVSKLYLVSLVSLLIRMGQFYDGSMAPQQFLDTYDKPLDKMLWLTAKKKLEKILAGTLPDQPFNPDDVGSTVHFDHGIVSTTLFN